jgi:hypothetical protein
MIGRRLTLLTAAALGAVIVAASCGVPQSGEYRPLGGDDVGELLATTTSTTTTVATTTIPVTTPTTVPETTTTALPLVNVDLYFVSGQQLTKVSYPLTPDPQPQQLLEVLVAGVEPLQPATAGTRSAIPAGAKFDVTVSAGVAEVDMNAEALTTISGDGALEFGQIVLTLLDNVPGIGQVKFSVLGNEQVVPRGDGSEVPAGTLVSRDDYATLLG